MRQYAFITARVPMAFKKELAAAVEKGTHLSESEFIRDAVRGKIRELNAVEEGA